MITIQLLLLLNTNHPPQCEILSSINLPKNQSLFFELNPLAPSNAPTNKWTNSPATNWHDTQDDVVDGKNSSTRAHVQVMFERQTAAPIQFYYPVLQRSGPRGRMFVVVHIWLSCHPTNTKPTTLSHTTIPLRTILWTTFIVSVLDRWSFIPRTRSPVSTSRVDGDADGHVSRRSPKASQPSPQQQRTQSSSLQNDSNVCGVLQWPSHLTPVPAGSISGGRNCRLMKRLLWPFKHTAEVHVIIIVPDDIHCTLRINVPASTEWTQWTMDTRRITICT